MTLAEYCDALKLAIRQVLLVPSSVSPIELARLLASDPRNPERLEARARHDDLVRRLRDDGCWETIEPNAAPLEDDDLMHRKEVR